MNKIFPTILVAVAIAISGYLVFVKDMRIPWMSESATPTPTDDLAGWETYQNPIYGFEFKYPKQWSFFDSQYRGGNTWTVRSPVRRESFAISTQFEPPELFIFEGEKREVIVAGKGYTAYLFPQGWECYGDTQPGDCAEMYIPVLNNDVWYIFSGGGDYKNLLSENYLRILSTFKFTK